jgi:hypothetical protein
MSCGSSDKNIEDQSNLRPTDHWSHSWTCTDGKPGIGCSEVRRGRRQLLEDARDRRRTEKQRVNIHLCGKNSFYVYRRRSRSHPKGLGYGMLSTVPPSAPYRWGYLSPRHGLSMAPGVGSHGGMSKIRFASQIFCGIADQTPVLKNSCEHRGHLGSFPHATTSLLPFLFLFLLFPSHSHSHSSFLVYSWRTPPSSFFFFAVLLSLLSS